MTSAPAHVIDRFASVGNAPSVVTIGNFDGVHLGHQYLLDQVTRRARELDVRPLIVTFEPHPVSVLRPDQPMPRISLPSHKMIAFRKSGISDVVVVPFDQEFASLTAEEFLDLVKTYTNPQEIIVGEGFRFGKARQGDGDYIKDYASRNGFSATVINRLESEDSIVSSSRIREALSSGNVERAESLLGRRFRLRGVVERGFARGRELGYPTANLMVVGELLVPDSGIYAGYVHIRNGCSHPARASSTSERARPSSRETAPSKPIFSTSMPICTLEISRLNSSPDCVGTNSSHRSRRSSTRSAGTRNRLARFSARRTRNLTGRT
ncbi:MAG: riboflavin kinase [Thermomicrobiales bacterium]